MDGLEPSARSLGGRGQQPPWFSRARPP